MSLRLSLLTLACAGLLFAIDPGRDFTGQWTLFSADRLSVPAEQTLAIQQLDSEIRCESGGVQWTYALNGTERKVSTAGDTRNSMVKWEGAALLINTIVTGAHDYVLRDRWQLSPGRATLRVTRQIVRGVQQEEGTLLYRREGQPIPQARVPQAAPPPPAPPAQPLARRDPAPPPSGEIVIRAGTHIPLTFRNTVDTRHSHQGERIYLQTAFPVAQDGRTVLPRGTFVNGTISQIKPPGHLAKGELFIRFDTITLPNGVTRDLRSRLATDENGKVEGDPDRGADAGKVGSGAGTGATVGVITGSAAGHPGMGAGVGGAAGGIASVLLSHGADASLPQGTTVDMVLDRDLHFRLDELR